MSSTTLPRGKDLIMKDNTKLALGLLIPPAILWGLIFLFMVDGALASYAFSKLNLTMMDLVYMIAGFIFPGASLVVGLNGLSKKMDTFVNLAVVVVSLVMLTLMAVNIFLSY